MLIYFVRHGITPDNKVKRFQTSETPLAPEGEVQAQKLAQRLKDTTIDELWTSPMARAHKTAEFINQYHQLELKPQPLLAEMKRATSLQGKMKNDPSIENVSRFLEDKETYDPNLRFEDGESYADVITRCRKIVKVLAKRAAEVPEDHLLCVTTHGMLLVTLFLVLQLGEAATPETCAFALRHLKVENTSLTIARMDQKGDYKILTFSDFAHL